MTTPHRSGGNSVNLVLGDCRQVMATLPEASVDHVITDPPFAEKTHAGARSGTDLDGRLIGFASFDDEAFLAFTREALRVARRWVVMFCDWRHAALLEPAGLPLVRFGVWVKPDGAPQFSGDRPATGWEAIAILHGPGIKRWNGGGRPAVWTCNIVKNQSLAPTQKPLTLVRQLVRDFTDPGDLVLDPYAGVGTTLLACLKSDRRAIGCEIDPNRYAIAQRRLDEARTPLLDAMEAS